MQAKTEKKEKKKTQDAQETIDIYIAVGSGWLRFSGEFTVPQAFAQLVINALDAGGNCVIEGSNEKKRVVIVDDGCGMSKQDLAKYARAGLPNPDKMADPKALGNQGTGKTACCTIGQEYELRTKIKSDNTVRVFKLTEQMLNDAFEQAKLTVPVGLDTRREDDPDSESFTKIVISNVRSNIDYNELRDTLDQFLPRKYNNLVMVNGERVKPFVMEGDQINFKKVYPRIGELDAGIMIPKGNPPRDMQLEIYAMSKVCSVTEFYRSLTKKQKELFPLVLLNKLLVGYIDIPSFNKKYAAVSRSKFSAQLFTQNVEEPNDLVVLLNALRFDLAPQVEQALGLIEDKEEKTHDDMILRKLKEEVGKTSPVPKEKKAEVKQGRIWPPRLEIEQGAREQFELRPSDTFKDPEWEVQGGIIAARSPDGSWIIFEAGSVIGTFYVKVYSKSNKENCHIAEVKVVETRKFAISPRLFVLTPGEAKSFRIIRKSKKTEAVIWQSAESGGTLNKTEGDEVVYTAGDAEGKFELLASDARPASTLVSSATIIIMKEKPEKVNPEDYLEYKGYKFKIGLFPIKTSNRFLDLQQDPRHDKVFELKFNKNHPRYQLADSDKARVLFLQDMLIYAYLLALHGDEGQEDKVISEIATISGMYFSDKEAKQKKRGN